MEDVRQAIQTGNAAFMAAFARGDAAGVAACYTAAATLLPPNSPAVNGTADITAFWQTIMGLGVKDAKLETGTVDALGDTAVEVGQYTLTIQPTGGESVTDVGKYVVVWKNAGGWKLHIDIWNSNNPTA